MSLEAGSDYDPQTLHTFNPSQLFAVQQGPGKRFTPPKQRMMMQAEPTLSPTSPVIVPSLTTARVLSQGGPCEGMSTASTASKQRIPSRSPVNRMASGPKLPIGSREVPRIHTTYGVAVPPPPLTLEELEQQVKCMQETQAAHEQALRRLGLQGVESSILQRITERVGWEKEAFREEMTSLVSMEMQSFKATVLESTSNELAVIRSKLEAVQASVTYQASVTQRFEARLQVPASAQPQPQVQAALLEAQETADLVMRELTQLRIQVDALQANTMDAHATSESAARELQQLKIHVDAMQATFDSHQTTVNQRLDLRSPGVQVPFSANSGVAEAALKAAEQLRARVEHLEASLDSRTAPPSPTNQLGEAKGPGDEVLAWDVQKLKVDMEASQAKIQELARASKGLAAVEKELQALQVQVQSAKVEAVPELEKQVLQLKSQVEASQGKDFSAIQAHIDRLQGDLSSFAGEQRDTLLVQMSQLRSDLSSTHGRTVQVEAQLGKLRNDVAVDRSANVHGQVEQMRGDLNTFISEQHNPLLAQMAQLRAESVSLPARTSQVEAQLVKMCADLAGLPRQVEASLWVAELKAQLAGLTTEVANLPRQGLEAELKSLQAELGSVATEQRESVLAQLAQLRGEVSGVFPRMTQLEAQGAQLRVQVSALPRSSEWEAQVANLRKEMQCLCQRAEPEGPGTFGLPTPRFELPDKEALRREVSMVLAEKGAAEAVDLAPVHSELQRFREATERMQAHVGSVQEEVRELRRQSFHLRPSVGTWLQKPQALDVRVFQTQLEELRGDVALLQRKPAGDVAPLQCRVEQLHSRILDLESRPAGTQAVEKLRAEVVQRLEAAERAPVQGQLEAVQKELAWALPKLQAMDLSPIQSQLDMLRKEWSWMVAKLQSVDLSSVEAQQESLQGEMARLGQRVQALDPTPVQSQLQVLRTKLASVEQTLQDPQRGAPVPLPLPQIDEFTVHERLDNFKTDVAYIMEKLQELDKPVPEAEDLVSVHVELDNFQAQLSKLTKEVAQLPEGSDIYKLQSQMARLEDEQLRCKHKLQELQEVPCAPGITEAELGKLRATAVRLEAQQEVLTSEQVRLGADLAAVVRGTPKGSPEGSPRGDEARLGEILEKVDALARQQQAHEVERSSDVQAQSRFRLAMDEKMRELESRAEKFLADAVKASDGYKVDVHDELLRVRQQTKACQEAVFELQSLNLPEEVLLLRSELEVLQLQPGGGEAAARGPAAEAPLEDWVASLQELQAKQQEAQRRLAALEEEPAGSHVRILDAVAGTEEAVASADVRALREQLEAERSQRDELAQRLMREVSEVARQVELRCQELDERVERKLQSSGEASGDGTGAGQSELKENQFVTFALVAELAARLDEEIAARKGLAKDAENRLSQSQRGWTSQDDISSSFRGSTSGGL